MTVIVERDDGDFDRARRLGLGRFEQAVRREFTRRGGLRPCLRIVRKLFVALADPAGVLAHWLGALERVQLLLADWREGRRRLAETEARRTAILDELHLSELATSITGLSALGAAAILAETGDHMPGSRRGRSSPGRSSGAPNSPSKAAPGYACRRGERSGEPNAPTRSMTPATRI